MQQLSHLQASALALILLCGAFPEGTVAAVVDMPENLALQPVHYLYGPEQPKNAPKVTASSAPAKGFSPQWAADGRTTSWCVDKNVPRGNDELTLEWATPVTVAELVYVGRTVIDPRQPNLDKLQHQFKDYEVYIDGAERPVLKGRFEKKEGPQRIKLPRPTRLSRVRLNFTSDYGGAEPGVSELSVFSSYLDDLQFHKLAAFFGCDTPERLRMKEDVAEGRLGFEDILLVKRHSLEISHVYVYHVEGFRPGGGLYIYSPRKKDGERLKRIFDAGEGMITTADLSYDGKEIVFAWKRGGLQQCRPNQLDFDVPRDIPKNNYQIFRINIDGTGLTQLTDEASNNLDPCWLPDGGIAFISDRKPAYAYCFVVTSPVLYRMDRDGRNQKRLSANYLMDFTPSVSNDGRVIYTRWEYVDRAACPIQSLWSINPDGTGLSGLFGNRVIAPGTFMDAQPVPGSQKILATATNHNGPCRGAIVLIDPARGRNNLDAIEILTPGIDIYIGGGVFGNGFRGPYEKPMPIGNDRYLVSNLGNIELRDFNYNMVPLLTIDRRQEPMGFYSPQPIRATARPPVVSGAPMDRSVELPEDGSVTGNWATVFVQDVYNGLEPHVKRGVIDRIAVVQELEKSTYTPLIHETPTIKGYAANTAFGFQFPLVSCGATYAAKKVWGFADVNRDGSAAFKVPSEVPIYFLALDKEGRAVQRMRSFTHLMPGEVQDCVGCHADRNSVAPQPGATLATRPKPQELQPPEWGVKSFSYHEVVQPVLDKHCVQCHNAREQAGKIDLSGDRTDFFNVSYDVLARTGTQGARQWYLHGAPKRQFGVGGRSPYVEWIWSINGAGYNTLEIAPYRWGSPASKLAEIISSGHPDDEGKSRVDVPDADRRRVYTWMDLNVPYYGTASSNHKKRIGSRRMYPPALDRTLQEVSTRRCSSCHEKGLPRTFYTRFENPQDNDFLLAPLAKSAGGTEKCGKPVFGSTDDPDYQRILKTFEPIHGLLERRLRADMDSFQLLPDEP